MPEVTVMVFFFFQNLNVFKCVCVFYNYLKLGVKELADMAPSSPKKTPTSN